MKFLRVLLACLAIMAVSLGSANAKINNGKDFFKSQWSTQMIIGMTTLSIV